MKTKIQTLADYYGSRKQVAEVLECSERQLYNIQNGKGGKHLRQDVINLYNVVVPRKERSE